MTIDAIRVQVLRLGQESSVAARDLAAAQSARAALNVTWGAPLDTARIRAADRHIVDAAALVEEIARRQHAASRELTRAREEAERLHVAPRRAAAREMIQIADRIAECIASIERDLVAFEDARQRHECEHLALGGRMLPPIRGLRAIRGLRDCLGAPVSFAVAGVPEPGFVAHLVGPI